MQKTAKNPNEAPAGALAPRKKNKLLTKIWKYKALYMMLLPAVVYVFIFKYIPIYGLQMAFQNYRISLGFSGSKWVGLKHFISFVSGYNFWDLVKNTLSISIYSLIVGFPIPIIVALLLNEVRPKLRKVCQTILYAPHFISTVVMVGIIGVMFSKESGIFNAALEAMGFERYYFLGEPEAFRHLYVWSGVWQGMGWSAIIYLAALSAVDPTLHEAAELDGASRLQRVIHVNLPTIMPTIIITLIMAVGGIASVGYAKVYLLQNELNMEVSEIISTYVYKRGIISGNYSFSSAVGLFNNVVNIIMLFIANTVSRKVSETSLF